MSNENKTPEELTKDAGPAKAAPAKRRAPAKRTAPSAPVAKAVEKKIVLFNTLGKEVPTKDYFHKGIIPAGFEGSCGANVTREDLLTVFHKVFKAADNILFYKQADKEVYLVIVPLKFSAEVGESHDSLDGDFQKHAISFLNEGSVNVDTLRQKLARVTKFVKYDDR